MTTPREQIVASIEAAKAELQVALSNLETMPPFSVAELGLNIHTLNNYLLVTGGFVSLLTYGLASHPDPDIQAWLAALQHATDLMAHTVRHLGSGTVGEVRVVRERVDMVKWAARVSTYYQGFAARKRICITFESAIPSPAEVWTDRVVAAVVLDNLLSNAVKYSQPGKHVRVRVTAEPAHLVCSVGDEGPGLSAEDQARLFQKGVRLTPRPTAGEPSSGFGLAIARELVEKLDGQIWCESEQGRGSWFSFRLPRYSDEAQGAPAAALSGPHSEISRDGTRAPRAPSRMNAE